MTMSYLCENICGFWRWLTAVTCLQGQKLHKRTGTPLYMAPELFMQYYGLESDMWALGILLYQMLSGELPFWEPGGDRSPWAIMTGILEGEVRLRGILGP